MTVPHHQAPLADRAALSAPLRHDPALGAPPVPLKSKRIRIHLHELAMPSAMLKSIHYVYVFCDGVHPRAVPVKHFAQGLIDARMDCTLTASSIDEPYADLFISLLDQEMRSLGLFRYTVTHQQPEWIMVYKLRGRSYADQTATAFSRLIGDASSALQSIVSRGKAGSDQGSGSASALSTTEPPAMTKSNSCCSLDSIETRETAFSKFTRVKSALHPPCGLTDSPPPAGCLVVHIDASQGSMLVLQVISCLLYTKHAASLQISLADSVLCVGVVYTIRTDALCEGVLGSDLKAGSHQPSDRSFPGLSLSFEIAVKNAGSFSRHPPFVAVVPVQVYTDATIYSYPVIPSRGGFKLVGKARVRHAVLYEKVPGASIDAILHACLSFTKLPMFLPLLSVNSLHKNDAFMSAWIAILVSSHLLEAFVMVAVDDYLASASLTSLFRDNSIFTKTMEYGLKLYLGRYADEVLGQHVIRPVLAKKTLSAADLSVLASSSVEAVFRSARLVPVPVKAMLSIATQRLQGAFPEILQPGRLVVASLLFLRFICPVILNPHLFSLAEQPYSESATLVLAKLARLIQSLVNPGCIDDAASHTSSESSGLSGHLSAKYEQPMKQFIHDLTSQPVPSPSSPSPFTDADLHEHRQICGYYLSVAQRLLDKAIERPP